MNRLARIIGLAIVPLLLAACADVPAAPGDGAATGGGAPGVAMPGGSGSDVGDRDAPMQPCGTEEVVGDGPDAAVGYTPCPDDPVGSRPAATRVVPTPGMADVRARGWDTADVRSDGRRIAISFVSGVEPCAVLDHVDVDYGDDAVAITLYEGHDPDAGDVACIDIGVFKQVVVELREPLGGRAVEDGAT